MAAAIGLRADHAAEDLRKLVTAMGKCTAHATTAGAGVIYEGGLQTEATRVGGGGLQIFRDGVRRPCRG